MKRRKSKTAAERVGKWQAKQRRLHRCIVCGHDKLAPTSKRKCRKHLKLEREWKRAHRDAA